MRGPQPPAPGGGCRGCAPDDGVPGVLARFHPHSALADDASAFLHEQWGGATIGVRTAVGVASLPGGQPVEIDLVAVAADLTGHAASGR